MGLSLGEERVNLQTNITEELKIFKTRQKCAEIIDELEKDRKNANSEKNRSISVAQTQIELACMAAIKAFYK